MAKIQLIPRGKLNKDVDINSLPNGDYSSAKNIVLSTGKAGGDKIVKIYESIKALSIEAITGTLKAAFLDADGTIYALYRKDSTNAYIYKFDSALTTKTKVVEYLHTVTTDFTPDLKKIGDILVWNYYGSGVVISWNTQRADGETVSFSDLVLAKVAPINAISVSKSLTENGGLDLLELNDFQFTCRYKYDTGEYSVLGNFTEMFKGEKDTSSYTVSFDTSDRPIYTSQIEVFVRIGESPTWNRIYTADLSETELTDMTWKGAMYEALDTKSSVMTYSAIPSVVKNIEIANDRIFLANFDDDYANDATGTLDIQVNSGYSIPIGDDIENYFGGKTTDAGVKSTENGTYYKPFANNSTYTVGVVFMDSAMKTRGVEYVKQFQTGLFSGPIIPTFTLNETGDAKPSWAKYMQLCITKNLSKSFIFEGFANSLYFELQYETTDPITSTVTKSTKTKLSVESADLKSIKHCVVDISGMFNAGFVYAYNPGDRITISCPNDTIDVVDGDGSSTGEYRLVDTQILASDGDKIYIKWNGGECLNDAIPDASKLYFEVYSPKQTAEDENLAFYAIGDVIDISSGIPNTEIVNYHIGDMVFSKISFAEYTDQLLYKGLTRSVPAISSNAITVIKSEKSSGSTSTIATTSVANAATTLTAKKEIAFTGFGATNEDAATISALGVPQITGFYDSRCKITLSYDYVIQRVISSNVGESIVRYNVFVHLSKIPYDPALNTYGVETQIGTKELIYSSDMYNTSLDDSTATFTKSSIDFEFNNIASILSSGDRLKVTFTVSVGTAATNAVAALFLKEKSGITDSCILTINGERITPVPSYSTRTNVTMASTKTTFAIRSMSNIKNVSSWNTSSGKPYLIARDKFSSRRTNSIRHSGNIIYGTEVNNISQFFALDTEDVPKENGDILSLQRATRIQGEGDMLLALCKNEISYVLLGESRSSQSDNSGFSGLTSSIIGSIRNLGEKTGIQDKESVYNHNGNIYWWDNFRNIVGEFTKKGVSIISENGMRSEFIGKSGIAKMAFDPFYDILFINVGGTTCYGFDKSRNEWVSEYDINFDQALHYGERCIFFKNGLLYRSLENTATNKVGEYFGTTYPAHITLTANTLEAIGPVMPMRVVLNHSMNVSDYSQANYVKASLLDIEITNENGQATDIKEVNFLLEDNRLFAYVLRDKNSTGGLVSGRHIRGFNNNFKINLKDFTQENRIFGLEIEIHKVFGH